MDNQIRALEIFKGIRCLDTESVNSTIEFLESPSAREQRQVVRTLIRKGYTNTEIYSEINRVFGSQAIMILYLQDQKPFTFAEIGAMMSINAIPAFFIYKVLKRRR